VIDGFDYSMLLSNMLAKLRWSDAKDAVTVLGVLPMTWLLSLLDLIHYYFNERFWRLQKV
jgi:hypothetical protein